MQLGDPGGIYRRALAAFPDQAMVKRYVDKVEQSSCRLKYSDEITHIDSLAVLY
jgi:hypothetical protein